VYHTPDNWTLYKLIDPRTAAGKCKLTAGGQASDYDLKQCVGLADALQAAKTYAETGQADTLLSWGK